MRILILEDEEAAAVRLIELVSVAEPGAAILATLETVSEAINWLQNNEPPDIILSDIQLADGLSFEVFRQVNVSAPIIFTTAFDEFAIKAFKLNSLDYLLKPIDVNELKAAFAKYHNRQSIQPNTTAQFAELLRQLSVPKENYKSRFLIKLGERLITIPVTDVAYIRADDRVVFLHTIGGQKHIIDDSLDDLAKLLDPVTFFRLNRTYISPLASIEKIQNHFNGRLKVTLKQCEDREIFVSRARVAEFKEWLNK